MDVEDPWWCVLGQLWSERSESNQLYGSGFRRVISERAYGPNVPTLIGDESIRQGFADPWFDERYDLLHRYWREEVYVRRRGSRR